MTSGALLLFGFLSITAFTFGTATDPGLAALVGNQFYYFGYGSNLLAKRIHVQNPTAERVGFGVLENYRLDFNTYTSRWLGAPATIVPTENDVVYGSLWLIDLSNLADIDDQEGVSLGIYEPITLPVLTTDNLEKRVTVMARAYVLVTQPTVPLNTFSYDQVPAERQPSKTYLQCLVKGAIETTVPLQYLNWLKSVRHNGKVVPELEALLDLKDVSLQPEGGVGRSLS